jgi:hypothetical protein
MRHGFWPDAGFKYMLKNGLKGSGICANICACTCAAICSPIAIQILLIASGPAAFKICWAERKEQFGTASERLAGRG